LSVHDLIYVSRATRPMDLHDLTELLRESRAKNAVLGVTGMLLYLRESFIQVLEGDEAVISALYQRICRDPRHEDVVLLESGVVAAREFPDWTMGFHDLDQLDPADLPGTTAFLERAFTEQDLGDGRAHDLLRMFKRYT
jgi:hypothetical protein